MSLLRNLATALFERERIRTTLMNAKELRPYAERLITLARREDDRLHARRLAARALPDRQVMKKLFDDLGARFASRPGGYTRILRLGPRRGDGAEMAIVELIGSEYKPEKKGDEKGKKGAAPSGGRVEGSPKPAGKAAADKGGGKGGGRKKAAEAKAEE
jgi:large subunit ribosomal protein L17